ncbi:tail fiber domain-containing protein [Flavobacterium ponti]|uniref:Tail fiber domain-containing protein n=1 Tax=Flavobacterium ponti TaxID=665133 RepID=A0ABV9P3Q1_9FLAO
MRKIIQILALFLVNFATAQVGIGNSEPKATLDVNKTSYVIGEQAGIAVTQLSGLQIVNMNTAGLKAGTLVYATSTSGIINTVGFWNWNGSTWVKTYGAKFVDGTILADAVFTTGKVGIGTSTPSEALEVNGNIRTNAVILNSDSNLKKEIKPLASVLEDLSQITTYSYYFKKDEKSSDLQFGLLAQEVQKIYPNLVASNGEYLGVNYIQLIPVLIKAIQELQVEVNFLKEQLKE